MDTHTQPDLKRNDEGIAAACEILAGRFGERMSRSRSMREQHAHTMTWLANQPPDAVIFAQTTQEVAEIVTICAEHRCPVIPFGIGSSLEGQLNAPIGGISIDFSQMNEIIEVHAEDLDVVVQPGVVRTQLHEYLRDTGLFSPIDPGAEASLGGMAATRASGTNAVRYGTMRENVLALQVVLASGRIIRTARRARKSAAGYDLTRLFIGAEGTLGIITDVTLKLYGVPEAISAGVISFPDMAAAIDAVILTIQSGIPVARIELLDEVQMDAINRYSDLAYPVQPTLFFEFHGSDNGVREQVEMVAEIAVEFGGGDFQWASRQEDRNKLWQARHDAYYAAMALRPGCKGWATDVCVPISELTECLLETRKDIDESGILAPIVSHAGDGNFHLVFLVDTDNPDEMARAGAVNDRMVARALAAGGTCTGEHGVGYGKIEFLKAEHGEAVLVMAQIKAALDPDNIMNPGKIL